MVIIVICLLTGKKIKSLKMINANNKNVNFPNQVCLGCITNKLDYVKLQEVSLKRNVYDFSVDHDAIDKSDILNFDKLLMVKNI